MRFFVSVTGEIGVFIGEKLGEKYSITLVSILGTSYVWSIVASIRLSIPSKIMSHTRARITPRTLRKIHLSSANILSFLTRDAPNILINKSTNESPSA